MDSISGTTTTTANLKSTDPLKPEMVEVDHCTRKLSQSDPQSRHHQLNEDLNDADPKDHKEISSLHDYNVQTVTPGNGCSLYLIIDSKVNYILARHEVRPKLFPATFTLDQRSYFQKNFGSC